MSVSSIAQSQLNFPATLRFQTSDQYTEYSSAYNYYIYRDADDFVWISSIAGLNRFDGLRFKSYYANNNDSTSLFDDNIQSSFFEDAKHNLWFATGHAIEMYNRENDRFESFFKTIGPDQQVPESYKVLFLERDTFLWFKAESDIYRYNIFESEASVSLVGISPAYTTFIDTTEDGQVKCLLFGNSGEDVFEYWEIKAGKIKDKKQWLDQEGLDISSVSSLSIDKNQRWIGTDKGLVHWDRFIDTCRFIPDKSKGECNLVPYDKDHLLLWGGKRGFQLFDKSEEKFLDLTFRDNLNNLILPEEVAYIYIDEDKNIWISFITDGFVHANPLKVKFESRDNIPSLNGKTDYTYTCIYQDSEENIWYGTKTQGLFCKLAASNKVQLIKLLPNINNWITTIVEDRNGNIWVSLREGVAKVDIKDGSLKLISTLDGATKFDVLYLKKLDDGNIIACTDENGVFKIIPDGTSFLLQPILKTTTSLLNPFEDSEGNIYISQNELDIGVYQLERETLLLDHTIPFKGFISGYVEDQANKKLWISTFSGLHKLDIKTQQFDTSYVQVEGLENKSIQSMLGDTDGNLWLGTPNGLLFFDQKKQSFYQYSMSDGIASDKFDLHAAAYLPSGTLLFGGDDGLTYINPGKIVIREDSSSVQITGIKINDEIPVGLNCSTTYCDNIFKISSITCPYEENTLSFEFVGIDYADPSAVQLSYKLEGVDKKFVKLKKGEPGFARYSNLKEGTYDFLVKSTNADGVLGGEIKKLELTVLPPVYRQWWFIMLMCALTAGIAYLAYRYRIQQIREKSMLKTRAVENKMTALRAQMNPHFIFNNLQTLSGLIARKEIKGSIEYVSQFARLMRTILENSRVRFISLEKEIELLDLYLKVEARRFRIPFGYQFQVSQNIDTYQTQIPSMLLQPFVENAIKHGLFHKKEKGEIKVIFNRENGSINCIIEDNGVGRQKSTEINSQLGREHQSRGLEIVEERLRIISEEQSAHYNIKIIDLFDRDKNPSGTRVEILLPSA